jgi:hypothetical protein
MKTILILKEFINQKREIFGKKRKIQKTAKAGFKKTTKYGFNM